MCIVAISEIPIIVEREKERNKNCWTIAAASDGQRVGQARLPFLGNTNVLVGTLYGRASLFVITIGAGTNTSFIPSSWLEILIEINFSCLLFKKCV